MNSEGRGVGVKGNESEGWEDVAKKEWRAGCLDKVQPLLDKPRSKLSQVEFRLMFEDLFW